MSDPTQEPILDALERQALALVEHGSAWDPLLEALRALPEAPPSLAPEQARGSGAELRLLVAVLRQQPSTGTTPHETTATRAGYAIEGAPGAQDACVQPAFAAALAAAVLTKQLAERFQDLWGVDARLAQLLDTTTTPRELALAWLQSPGRLLVQDLSILSRIPEQPRIGATDLSPAALDAAAGPLLPLEQPDGWSCKPWRELHDAVPGSALGRWRPADGSVATALQILEGRRGGPVLLRGAALAWLLGMASQDPFYLLDSFKRDLREDLLPALLAGFPSPENAPHSAQLRAAARLEAVCLLHGARLTAGDASTEAVARAWNLARWIQSCSFRSPFFGGDDEALAARLHALLPKELGSSPRRDDVLDASLFGDEQRGLPLEELAFVAGVAQHYGAEGTPKLLPTPLPLVNALRRLAARQLSPADLDAETRLARLFSKETENRPGNVLGWAAPHLAPPLVARWVMTNQRIGWMQRVPVEVLNESLELFAREPLRHPWVAFAFYAEGAQLPEGVRERSAEVWRDVMRKLAAAPPGKEEELLRKAGPAHMAAGLLDRLSDDEAQSAIELTRTTEPEWRHRVLEGLAESAERLGRDAPWRAAMDGLLEMVRQESLDPQERVKAALLALRRLSARPSSHPDRTAYVQKLAAAASSPPFNQNVTLRRELRKYGVSSPA